MNAVPGPKASADWYVFQRGLLRCAPLRRKPTFER